MRFHSKIYCMLIHPTRPNTHHKLSILCAFGPTTILSIECTDSQLPIFSWQTIFHIRDSQLRMWIYVRCQFTSQSALVRCSPMSFQYFPHLHFSFCTWLYIFCMQIDTNIPIRTFPHFPHFTLRFSTQPVHYFLIGQCTKLSFYLHELAATITDIQNRNLILNFTRCP